jgi:hypothetical protein
MTEHIWRDCPKCGKECRFKAEYIGDIGVCRRCAAEFCIERQTLAEPQVVELFQTARRRSREDQILDAMAAWLVRREYQVEGQWRNPNGLKEVVVGKAAAFAAKRLAIAMIGHAVPGLRISLQAGANEKKVAEAMEPYIRVTDFVAVQFGTLFSVGKSNHIIPIILADDLRPDEVTWRFQTFMKAAGSVAKLGIRTNHQHHGMIVHPLVVYSRSTWFAEDGWQILRCGWQRCFWGKIYLQAAVIDVQRKRIEWAERTGLARVGTLLGVKPPITDGDMDQMFGAMDSF